MLLVLGIDICIFTFEKKGDSETSCDLPEVGEVVDGRTRLLKQVKWIPKTSHIPRTMLLSS